MRNNNVVAHPQNIKQAFWLISTHINMPVNIVNNGGVTIFSFKSCNSFMLLLIEQPRQKPFTCHAMCKMSTWIQLKHRLIIIN